ncbi:DUF1205 domain-containing protein [Herbidospora galbida]|uniref:DUF1205 domain-containing protein n=1 Tax=Herbidospora galbida TaxID=2575442 RepID=A0A4U3LU94_9ACTN|nr:nucleotide disphospho-sugar-binding domain-containing protein [Herbidospora galbida]TKK79069.1 DUF1205 domain-containing protein [Herbidospora galbida]
MRVLFVTPADPRLFQYLVPLAWALRTAGHEVRISAQPGFADVVTQAGLTAQPIGKDHDPWNVRDADAPAPAGEGLPAPYDVAADPSAATWEGMREGYAGAVDAWHKLENFAVVPDLVAFARFWRPDLVIWEQTTYAGAVAAKACGAAHGRFMFGLDIFGVTRQHFLRLKGERAGDPLAEWLGTYATKYGLRYTEDLAVGQFTVDQLPASLRLEADVSYLPVRFTSYEGPAVVAKWLWGPAERTRVAVLAPAEGYPVPGRAIAEALAGLDAEIVLVTDEELTGLPENVRVTADAPLHALVPTCAAVVHHGDFGELASAARAGVPQVVLPWHFDQPLFADRLAASGAGLRADATTAGEIRAAVERVLTEPGFGTAAARLREETAALPAPNEVVGRLEELAVKYAG